MAISIVHDYSDSSHVLMGDFKDQYSQFREEVLRPATYAHFNSRLYTGPGWIIDKAHVDELLQALKQYNLQYEEETFDANLRETRRKENWRRAYQRRRSKVSTSKPTSKPSTPKPMDVETGPVSVDHTQWAKEIIDKELVSLGSFSTQFIYRSVLLHLKEYLDDGGQIRLYRGFNILVGPEEKPLVALAIQKLQALGFDVFEHDAQTYFVTRT